MKSEERTSVDIPFQERSVPPNEPGCAITGGKAISLGHTSSVYCLAQSGNGLRIISGSHDKTLRIWDVENLHYMSTLKGHTATVFGVALSSDGRYAVSGAEDSTVRVWNVDSGKCLATLKGHTGEVLDVALSKDGRIALSGSHDKTIRVWDVERAECLSVLHGHTKWVLSVALSSDGRFAISGSDDNTVRIWDVESGFCLAILEGHTSSVQGVALSGDGHRAVSGSHDKTVRVWDVESGRCLASLEGHTDSVNDIALSDDGRRVLSGSSDKTVRVWDVDNGQCIATLEGHTDIVLSVILSDDGLRAFSCQFSGAVRVWSLEGIETPPTATITMEFVSSGGAVAGGSAVVTSHSATSRYTNAKVLLVGDSGVGKTGLAYRLTENRFVESISTDGVETKCPDWATQLKLEDNNGSNEIEREIWLWDFAGQADYRLIHQLFMDETALAVLVFNPQSENPFEGLSQWDSDLIRASRRPFKKLLVAGRCDRGGLMVSNETIENFRQEKGFAEYISTSAFQGTGCDDLRDAIIRHISWEDIPWTTSPRIFRILKEEILKLKDEGNVLLRAVELKQQLELRLPNEAFTMEELRAVVGLLAGPGIVWQLEFGDFVLLHPERVNSYAAAVIRSVRSHTEEIGCIAEEKVLAGELNYQDIKRLQPDEEQVVLRAMNQKFVNHGLCLREKTGHGHQLVFPSYFRRERPELDEHPLVLVTYRFNGPLDEIYATLVVRLHHSIIFEYDKLWRFAADFKTPSGKRLGLKMTKKNEGAAELEVYFETGISDEIQVTFIRYVHEHLKQKAHEVIRLRHYVCPHCDTLVEARKAIEIRFAKGFKDIACAVCEKRVPLLDLIEEKFASEEFQRRVRELEEQATIAIDNESRELILVGHAFAIAGEAGQIFRPTPNSDWGIDGEIEFKDNEGNASGRRLYLQLKSGDSYLYPRKADGGEIFTIRNERHADYWQQQAYPVMLVIRRSDGTILWMDVSEYLKRECVGGKKAVKQVVFTGAPFTALNLRRMRDTALGALPYSQEKTCQ